MCGLQYAGIPVLAQTHTSKAKFVRAENSNTGIEQITNCEGVVINDVPVNKYPRQSKSSTVSECDSQTNVSPRTSHSSHPLGQIPRRREPTESGLWTEDQDNLLYHCWFPTDSQARSIGNRPWTEASKELLLHKRLKCQMCSPAAEWLCRVKSHCKRAGQWNKLLWTAPKELMSWIQWNDSPRQDSPASILPFPTLLADAFLSTVLATLTECHLFVGDQAIMLVLNDQAD